MVARSLNPLLDMLTRVRWRVVDQDLDVLVDDDYIEVIPQDRAQAWNDLFILALRQTPFTYRTNLRTASLQYFDYNQPIYYSLKHHQLVLVYDELVKSLQPPIYAAINNEIINPFAVMIVFILLLLSCVAWEGFDKKQRH